MATSKSKTSNTRKRDRRKGDRRGVEVRDVAKENNDMVNHPNHYGGDTPYEVIKVLEAWELDFDFDLGNCIKYIARAGKKETTKLEDLRKAAWYLNRRIERIQGMVQNNVRS
jgi:ribosomal protein L32